jgi:hypothetical protein
MVKGFSIGLSIVGLMGSLALMAGCVGAPESGADDVQGASLLGEESTVTSLQGKRFSAGTCHNDGIVVHAGNLYRSNPYTGVRTMIGADATGVTLPHRSRIGAGDVCHNTTKDQELAQYVCNSNGGGSFSGSVSAVQEYVDGQPIMLPASTTSNGLYYGHLDVRGACDDTSVNDYAIWTIECCMGAPSLYPSTVVTPITIDPSAW